MEENVVWENDWAKFMAMDENGDWWEYEEEPFISIYGDWNSGGKLEVKNINLKYKPEWKKSLIKREKENKMEDNIIWENDWAEYMAMDENGRWWEYSHTPLKRDLCWYRYFNTKLEVKTVIPNHKPHWKESLIKRKGKNKMEIKTVQIYETSDNSVFRDLKEAEEHQKKVDLDELIFKNGYSKEDAMTFSNFIMKNKEEITKILNRKDQ